MRLTPQRTALLACALLALLVTLPVAAASSEISSEAPAENLSPSQEAEEINEQLGFGFSVQDGRPALALDTTYTFCADAPSLVYHPGFAAEAMANLGATDNGDGTWTVPDPDDGTAIKVTAQAAAYLFDDGSGDPTVLQSEATLPVLSSDLVSLIYPRWNRCWRWRRYRLCNRIGNCGYTGCFWGYQWSQNRSFRVCGWTGQPWDYCREFLYPVCRLTRYTCRDCTGPILWQRNYNRWVCWLY